MPANDSLVKTLLDAAQQLGTKAPDAGTYTAMLEPSTAAKTLVEAAKIAQGITEPGTAPISPRSGGETITGDLATKEF